MTNKVLTQQIAMVERIAENSYFSNKTQSENKKKKATLKKKID